MIAYLETKSPAQVNELQTQLEREYELLSGNRMALDLSRGKPAAEQLSLSEGLEQMIDGDYRAADGSDVRNYGNLQGLPEARELGAELLDVPAETVLAGGNSSLSLMHLAVSTAMQPGLWGDTRQWSSAKPIKVLTPVPGYDRHFALCEALGIQMVNIDMTDSGPNMSQARALVEADDCIKGIWCVPKYSNPTGCIYSQETVDEIAQLSNIAAADDFVVLWDNAYAWHDFEFPPTRLTPIYPLAQHHGTENHVVQFASTSKITFAGAGVGFISSGAKVLQTLAQQLSFRTIGPDKVNQLRHARFLKGRLMEHMQAHATLLKPKFDLVLRTLKEELGQWSIASWTEPQGGYFVSLDLQPNLASEVIDMAKQVGLTLTPAGATFPMGKDPKNCNVRIAPTFATLDDLGMAMQVLTLCVKLATVRQFTLTINRKNQG